MKISVIIPLAANENQHQALIASLPAQWEIIPSQEGSRAKSLNMGAAKATGDYLWFLHADSTLGEGWLAALKTAIENHPDALLYFDLAFRNDATPLMWLNALGARFRSRILGVPFGDQGFCIRKALFEKLGGFPEGLAYGEDHVFVWRARQAGIKLKPTNATITTSARKYQAHGWAATTFMHQYLWVKQAWPEWRKCQ
ncbi:MAG: glycosyltransferase [Alphaproteobacteria bacterium]